MTAPTSSTNAFFAEIVNVRLDWNHTAIPLRIGAKFFTVEICPQPEYPFGRKGLALARIWEQVGSGRADGMLILDGDVAIDPLDYGHMLDAIETRPDSVHTAPVMLWPVSTHLDVWVWGHGRAGRYSQEYTDDDLDMFTFCFTYLPGKLLETCLQDGLDSWVYPHVDANVCARAQQIGTPVHLVRDARPKHLNY
jgi:hypothetical protein